MTWVCFTKYNYCYNNNLIKTTIEQYYFNRYNVL